MQESFFMESKSFHYIVFVSRIKGNEKISNQFSILLRGRIFYPLRLRVVLAQNDLKTTDWFFRYDKIVGKKFNRFIVIRPLEKGAESSQ